MDAGVISALAAVGALFLALQTVRETRKLRREDRLARLPELAAELGDMGVLVASGREHPLRVYVARERLRAGVTAAGEKLPACERLLETNFEEMWKVSDPHLERDAKSAIAEALEELAALLSRGRAS